MKIVFFGTSHGVPEAHRKCSCTMIEIGESRYFIDMGMHVVEQLTTRNIPIESVKAVFVTHMHSDHTQGLISFADLCSWYFKKTNPIFVLPEPLKENIDCLGAWLKCNGTELREFDFRPVNEGSIYQDENIKITAFKTQHTNMSYSFLVEAEGKRVLFSGDLSVRGPQVDFPVSVFEKPVDLAICESAHFPATAYLPLFENQKNLKRLCFNHYVYNFIPSILDVKRKLNEIPCYVAEDDMEIIL